MNSYDDYITDAPHNGSSFRDAKQDIADDHEKLDAVRIAVNAIIDGYVTRLAVKASKNDLQNARDAFNAALDEQMALMEQAVASQESLGVVQQRQQLSPMWS